MAGSEICAIYVCVASDVCVCRCVCRVNLRVCRVNVCVCDLGILEIWESWKSGNLGNREI